ncbi:flagellar brake domain-containing protein [Microaerobacter geothermalis]|uniref:flagellar brake protein n=1 Tax=Microaerobacter geothermalis TaxID=674972 RepID=UPI001F383135|nr:flagellar brake domain-containing protein [Microaerobacter geothermalis]MCF6093518.1 flagellar brake domain-containing protein [Microaerobacter geothermalis]
MYPTINQMLFFQILTTDEEEVKKEYKARVADRNEHYIATEIPLEVTTGRMKIFLPGTEILVWYIAADGSRIQFKTQILGRKEDQIPLLIIKTPSIKELKKTQRRNFLRVPAELELSIQGGKNGVHVLVKTRDISGGGVAFTCEEQVLLKKDDELVCWLVLPLRTGGVTHANFIGKVLRVEPPKEKGLHQWVSLKIDQISNQDQQKLVRYCFERQLELRKKGYFDSL